MKEKPELEVQLGKALFDVEHALGMYATSFCTLPAEAIYDQELLAPYIDVIKNCHIYLIGYLPKIDFIEANQELGKLNLTYMMLGKKYILEADVPSGFKLIIDGEMYYLTDQSGEMFWPDESLIVSHLSQNSNVLNFEVKYIGQAYGKNGSRNAIDRLLKHETLQKISIKGIPEGYKLTLILLTIQPNNQLITLFNPHAQNNDQGSSRIKLGLDKLYGTTEEEQVSLYEASLIRYFSPQYNIEFKNSFPSTNLKILEECYAKDFAAVVAEICIDNLPFKLFSESVEAKPYHIAKFSLHTDEARKFFFSQHL